MFVQRYYLECLSHTSFMVADEQTKIAAVIDPQRDIDIYLMHCRWAMSAGLTTGMLVANP